MPTLKTAKKSIPATQMIARSRVDLAQYGVLNKT